MATKTTCGLLYQQARAAVLALPQAGVDLYAAGFANGHAEKVYLGACLACMFRPPTMKELGNLQPIYRVITDVYGLYMRTIWELGETWLCRQTGPAHAMILDLSLIHI